MDTFHHIASIRTALSAARKAGKRIGLVPTMGNLHAAHLALVKSAQQRADVVVVSIFVNRLQFGLNEDWDAYPRTLEADVEQLKAAGCDYLLVPDEKEMYPNGMDLQTRVIVPGMADVLCGASRPGHFDGVTTVVSKLFNITQPDMAVFGIKDYQQLAIIRRMVQDLCLPVEIIEGDIVREQDGLAMSSRNVFITADERPRANQLHRTIQWVMEEIRQGDRLYSRLQQSAQRQIEDAGFKVDYLKVCNAHTLEPAARDDLDITVLGAMYTQRARLIDNASLSLTQ